LSKRSKAIELPQPSKPGQRQVLRLDRTRVDTQLAHVRFSFEVTAALPSINE
jgi:hypothetical protein